MIIERIKLKKLNNTRDLGGFPAEGGKHIKKKMLIRSGRLYKLPEKTVAKLKAMGVSTVIDLRTERERLEHPSTIIEGIEYIYMPLTCTATTGITYEKSMAKTMKSESKRIKEEFGTAENYMVNIYEIILTHDDSRQKLKKFFDILLRAEGCVLWHCSAGQDRTGICAMLLEAVLGVDEELIIKDYTATNRFQRGKRNAQKLGLLIAPVSFKFKKLLFAMMKAKRQYIVGALEYIKREYGSVVGYCKQALGVTDEEILKLKDKYLE